MHPSLLDHTIAVSLLLVLPFFGKRNFARFQKAVRTGGPGARARQYRKIIIRQWALAGAVVAVWLSAGRSIAGLGFTLPAGVRSVWGLAITLLILGALFRQARAIRDLGDDELASSGSKIGDVADLLPHTDREAAIFRGVAITAGVCEETLYRGFLIAYLAMFVELWLGAIVAGVMFGFAHAYQGRSGMIKTGVTGVVNGLLFVGTGSLVWPILLHAGLDLHGGVVGRRVLEAGRAAGELSAPDGAP